MPLCQSPPSSEEHAPVIRHQTNCSVLIGVNKKLNIFCYKTTYSLVVNYEFFFRCKYCRCAEHTRTVLSVCRTYTYSTVGVHNLHVQYCRCAEHTRTVLSVCITYTYSTVGVQNIHIQYCRCEEHTLTVL